MSACSLLTDIDRTAKYRKLKEFPFYNIKNPTLTLPEGEGIEKYKAYKFPLLRGGLGWGS
ncbi:MAG: hypothetical protein HW421_731 [Ignavibacteria bacterium]|nr:hypothetical protein [Ignavibacteria bacterium]